jgi:hypothetical protein
MLMIEFLFPDTRSAAHMRDHVSRLPWHENVEPLTGDVPLLHQVTIRIRIDSQNANLLIIINREGG